MLRRLAAAGERPQDLEDGGDVRLHAGAHVEGAAFAAAERLGVGLGDVLDVDEVARLVAVPGDRRGLTGQQLPAEDGHHSGLPVRVLARPVDVGVTEGGVGEPGQVVEGAQVPLSRELGSPVGRDRPGGRILRCGYRLGLAVEGAAGRGEEEALNLEPGAGPQQGQGSQHVHPRVEEWILDRPPHAGLGGLVHDGVRPLDSKQLLEPG